MAAPHRNEFLPDVYVMCEVCRGRRYNSETLAVRYKNHSISDVLNLPSVDALKLLENIPQIQQKLATLVEVGLGYVTLGQSATTLSGGEASASSSPASFQRQTGRTLYILDEPTTGLHFDDVRKLLDVLQRLVDLGNTVLIIEHHSTSSSKPIGSLTSAPKAAKAAAHRRPGPAELVARTKSPTPARPRPRSRHLQQRSPQWQREVVALAQSRHLCGRSDALERSISAISLLLGIVFAAR